MDKTLCMFAILLLQKEKIYIMPTSTKNTRREEKNKEKSL